MTDGLPPERPRAPPDQCPSEGHRGGEQAGQPEVRAAVLPAAVVFGLLMGRRPDVVKHVGRLFLRKPLVGLVDRVGAGPYPEVVAEALHAAPVAADSPPTAL